MLNARGHRGGPRFGMPLIKSELEDMCSTPGGIVAVRGCEHAATWRKLGQVLNARGHRGGPRSLRLLLTMKKMRCAQRPGASWRSAER